MADGANDKFVLVCVGERKRGVSFLDNEKVEEERKALLASIRETYKDVTKFDDNNIIVLQIKSMVWVNLLTWNLRRGSPTELFLEWFWR